MAGRGRGQSRMTMLENMGIERSEMHMESMHGSSARLRTPGQSGVTTQAASVNCFAPAPTYPPLQFKPLKRKKRTPEQEYELMLLTNHIEKMRNSRFAIKEEKKETEIERYSDRYRPAPSDDDLNLRWEFFPLELWPKSLAKPLFKKRKAENSRNAAVKRVKLGGEMDSQLNKLQELEEKEKSEGADDAEEDSDDEEENDRTGASHRGMELEELEDEDEEMDEGTDYAQCYFDNGEEYGGGDDDALEDENCI